MIRPVGVFALALYVLAPATARAADDFGAGILWLRRQEPRLNAVRVSLLTRVRHVLRPHSTQILPLTLRLQTVRFSDGRTTT